MIKFLKRDAFNFIRWLPIYHVAELCLLCGHIDALLILGPKPGQQRVLVHTCPWKNPLLTHPVLTPCTYSLVETFGWVC